MIKPWMVIVGITFLVSFGSFFIKPRDVKWAAHLSLPKWLVVFEPAIPVIWNLIFLSGAISASIIWDKDPGSLKTWLLMATYLLLEIVTVTYIPATLRLRNLSVGTIIGGAGLIVAILLTLSVLPISSLAAALLIPYLVWSPIGTYGTWKMTQLNPDAA
ncbi:MULTISPECIES: TspO/MBR family protein [Cyanophyceae]|uniref:TspO/MBR family protein n=1 Tax=Cyanophyceae TaxID=3028117 RepID=UPI0016844639|nr:tryptophan-rich sensory protein [Trichocoleus sp. FACHB-69]MBD1933575.1 tryptophan-rich sensory protein [Trichocoleus sp. FACHB-69]